MVNFGGDSVWHGQKSWEPLFHTLQLRPSFTDNVLEAHYSTSIN